MKFFSSVCVDKNSTHSGIQEVLDRLLESDPGCILLLIGSQALVDLDQLPAIFSKQPVPVYGGIVPGLIQEQEHFFEGVLALGFNRELRASVIEDITRPENEIYTALKQWSKETVPAGAVVMLDGQSRGIDDFVACLYDCLGPDPSVMGGGLGYLDLSPGPCLVTASGVHENAALVLSLPAPMAFGLHHGFNSVAGPFLVTESDGNVIHSINYQSAFSFYKDVLEKQLGHSIELDDFEDISKNYPFGMLQLDNEFLVRDPLQWQGDSITCAGCIPENTTVYILHSTADGLIDAAAEAAKDLNANLLPAYGDHQGYFSFLIDCISRVGFLGDRYSDELQAIKKNLPDGTPLIGILTLGEIASSTQGSIHFLNKTTVVGGVKR